MIMKNTRYILVSSQIWTITTGEQREASTSLLAQVAHVARFRATLQVRHMYIPSHAHNTVTVEISN